MTIGVENRRLIIDCLYPFCKRGTIYCMNITSLFLFASFKTAYFYCLERILFSVKSFLEGKLVYGENLLSGKIVRRGKFSSGKKILHLTKFSSLFPDEDFPDKVSYQKGILVMNILVIKFMAT